MNYSVNTKLSCEQVVVAALKHFGEGGVGLDVTGQGADCVSFEGGGGHVEITACRKEGGKRSEVNILTREWDYQVKEFMGQIKG
ncbi:MAG TPA: hypothetical protein VMX15_04800 [Candidatus Heimdallarchaeota archaeon]|nr:hypothetical protein [Candidatus Heimdallarchaeota archaeon]